MLLAAMLLPIGAVPSDLVKVKCGKCHTAPVAKGGGPELFDAEGDRLDWSDDLRKAMIEAVERGTMPKAPDKELGDREFSLFLAEVNNEPAPTTGDGTVYVDTPAPEREPPRINGVKGPTSVRVGGRPVRLTVECENVSSIVCMTDPGAWVEMVSATEPLFGATKPGLHQIQIVAASPTGEQTITRFEVEAFGGDSIAEVQALTDSEPSLGILARRWRAGVQSDDLPGDSAAMGEVFLEIARSTNDGLIVSRNEFMTTLRAELHRALGDRLLAWEPWFLNQETMQGFEPWLAQREAEQPLRGRRGRDALSMDQYADFAQEIGESLSEVQPERSLR